MNNDLAYVGCLFWLAALAILAGSIWLFWPVWPFEGDDRISSYPAFCSTSYVRDRCSVGEQPGTPTEYRIDKANKEVSARVYGSEGFFKYVNCEIHDKGNWNCRYPTGSVAIEMVGGKRTRIVFNIRYVSEWEFRWLQVMSLFDN